MSKGKIIVIEGVDSSGKETQTKLLKEKLEKKHIPVMTVSFPRYGSPFCKFVELYLSGYFGDKASNVNPYIASSMYAIDRYGSMINDNWKEFYNNGGIVIFDRYVLSNVIHQGALMEVSERAEYINWLYDLEYNKIGLPVPDKIIFLDMLPELAQLLIKDRPNKINGEKEKDIIEKDINFMKQSYLNAMNIATEQKWLIQPCYKEKGIYRLNNIKSPEEVNVDIYNKIKDIL